MCDYNIIWVLKGELIITELTVAMIYVYIISWGDTGLVVNCLRLDYGGLGLIW